MNARAGRRSVLVSAGGAGVELTASISELSCQNLMNRRLGRRCRALGGEEVLIHAHTSSIEGIIGRDDRHPKAMTLLTKV
jgi:hypothetical protein